jgi:hypothetical protein
LLRELGGHLVDRIITILSPQIYGFTLYVMAQAATAAETRAAMMVAAALREMPSGSVAVRRVTVTPAPR